MVMGKNNERRRQSTMLGDFKKWCLKLREKMRYNKISRERKTALLAEDFVGEIDARQCLTTA